MVWRWRLYLLFIFFFKKQPKNIVLPPISWWRTSRWAIRCFAFKRDSPRLNETRKCLTSWARACTACDDDKRQQWWSLERACACTRVRMALRSMTVNICGVAKHEVGCASITRLLHGGQTLKKQTLSKMCRRKHLCYLRADDSNWCLYVAKQIYGAFKTSPGGSNCRPGLRRSECECAISIWRGIAGNLQCTLHTGITRISKLLSASSPEVSPNKAFELASANSQIDK